VPESKTWRQELAKALRTMWLFKMLSTMGAIAVFFYAYFWVMRHPLSTVTTMPEIGIEGEPGGAAGAVDGVHHPLFLNR